MSRLEQVKQVKAKHEHHLLEMENVVGVGIGKKNRTLEVCIKVYVTIKKPENALAQDDIIPKVIEGIKTDVVESGAIRFQN